MSQRWYIEHGQKIVGPVSAIQLRHLAENAKIEPTTRIRLGEDGKWRKASMVKGLFADPKPTVEPVAKATPTIVTAEAVEPEYADAEVVEVAGSWKVTAALAFASFVAASMLNVVRPLGILVGLIPVVLLVRADWRSRFFGLFRLDRILSPVQRIVWLSLSAGLLLFFSSVDLNGTPNAPSIVESGGPTTSNSTTLLDTLERKSAGGNTGEAERIADAPISASAYSSETEASPSPKVLTELVEIGEAYVVSEQTPLMPSHSPADPIAAVQRMKQIPRGGRIRVIDNYNEYSKPWFKVTAYDDESERIGTGWINSVALFGQKLKVYAEPPEVIADYSKETYRTWESATGHFSISARIVDFDNVQVVLERRSGKRGEIALQKLSWRDQQYVMATTGWGRVWSTGDKKFIADFVSATDRDVILQRVDGSESTYSISEFESSDRRYIEARRTTVADAISLSIGKVVGVADGDTITVLTELKRQIKIRINGIDAPEIGQAFGQKAKQRLSALCFGKTVAIEATGKDKYGRTLATVYAGGDQSVNAAHTMLRDGLAWHYKKYSDDAEMSRLEDSARNRKVGIWSEANVVPPWDWRRWGTAERRNWLAEQAPPTSTARGPPTTTSTKAVTKTHWLNTNSGVRHNRGCRWFGGTKNGRACNADEGHACGICGG